MKKRDEIILGEKRVFRRTSDVLKRRVIKIGIAVVLVNYFLWAAATMDEETRRHQAMVDISRIEKAARLFRADYGRCPQDIEELFNPPNETKYLEERIDPWGTAYHLTCPSPRDPGGVVVVSGGPDGAIAGKDDISSL